MSSRRVAEAHSVVESLVRVAVGERASSVSATISATMHTVRLLNELQDELMRHGGARFAAALCGVEGPERAGAALEASVAVADAKVRAVDAAYGELDACVRDLDRRLRLGDAVLRLHGAGLAAVTPDDEAAALRSLVRPADAVSARAGRRIDAPDQAALARARALEVKQRLAAAMGGATAGGAGADAGVHDAAITLLEPTYCICGQVAFGEMIACESDSCVTEWFHSACVGLTPSNRPLGKWFCPPCTGGSLRASGGGAGADGGAGGNDGNKSAVMSKPPPPKKSHKKARHK